MLSMSLRVSSFSLRGHSFSKAPRHAKHFSPRSVLRSFIPTSQHQGLNRHIEYLRKRRNIFALSYDRGIGEIESEKNAYNDQCGAYLCIMLVTISGLSGGTNALTDVSTCISNSHGSFPFLNGWAVCSKIAYCG